MHVNVYDVLDRPEQDRIVAAIKATLIKRDSKPVDLRFFDHENWLQDGNLGTRHSERQLRRVRISKDRVRDVAGEKLVEYGNP